MGMMITEALNDLLLGVQPFFDFLQILWSAFPLAFRYVFAILFGVAITFTILRNFVL